MDGAWVGGDSEMYFCRDALLPHSREIGLVSAQGRQHLHSKGFIRDPGVYWSVCMQRGPLQMRKVRRPAPPPRAVLEKLCLGSPGFNSHFAVCQPCDSGHIVKSLCTS